MKIFSANQIREWDQYTIQHEPISSIDLMERAALRCNDWIINKFSSQREVVVVCGPGNNGGDGLAIARLLHTAGFKVEVCILLTGQSPVEDNRINLARLNELNISPRYFSTEQDFPEFGENAILVEALFGSGLNRKLEGATASFVDHVNRLNLTVISIDIPAGMFVDKPVEDSAVIHASYTLTFQVPKLCFLVPESEQFVGDWIVLDIGLHRDYYLKENSKFYFLSPEDLRLIYKKRKRFAHKGSFGHAALFAGSYGMLGAGMLAGSACLRSGVGKLTMFTDKGSYPLLQVVLPEAIYQIDDRPNPAEETLTQFQAIGVGPGIGINEENKKMLQHLFTKSIPLVLDADALNILAAVPEILQKISPQTILTPHVKELERLFGTAANGFERIEQAKQKAAQFNVVILVKGHYSFVCTPDGEIFFNSTGNPGMATAGSGDVLTGIITGLRAQGYPAIKSCLLGMWLHGFAGDKAAEELSQEGLIASDIVQFLPRAFKYLI